ncbi:MAG: hypothetical protein WA414_11635 [Acidobacteriaceae bacterium]
MGRSNQSRLHLFPKGDPATGKRWALGEQDRAALDEICLALNSETHRELRFHLRAWIEGWQASGPNLRKLFGSLPDPQRTALTVAMRTMWSLSDGGRAELLFVPDWPALEGLLGNERVWRDGQGAKQQVAPEVEALCLFHLLTVNPLCDKLAGPCPRCDSYYIKKRASQRIYCSRRCGNAATAVARTRERIADERKGKLARARAAMKKWKPTSTRQDWKHWVSTKTGIDQRFLTRAVTKGDLMPPKQET